MAYGSKSNRPEETKCEALTKIDPTVWHYRHRRRCARRAVSGRLGRAVCHQHCYVKVIEWYDKGKEPT